MHENCNLVSHYAKSPFFVQKLNCAQKKISIFIKFFKRERSSKRFYISLFSSTGTILLQIHSINWNRFKKIQIDSKRFKQIQVGSNRIDSNRFKRFKKIQTFQKDSNDSKRLKWFKKIQTIQKDPYSRF